MNFSKERTKQILNSSKSKEVKELFFPGDKNQKDYKRTIDKMKALSENSLDKKLEKFLYTEKIGFKRTDHADETIDLLKDFAATGDMLNKELEKKLVKADNPIVQEILTILDDNLSVDSKFLEEIQKVLDLIQELPDKEKKDKIGFIEYFK
jgi:LPS O-antigen subunit length determinant protein (WzzB/FepE family)